MNSATLYLILWGAVGGAAGYLLLWGLPKTDRVSFWLMRRQKGWVVLPTLAALIAWTLSTCIAGFYIWILLPLSIAGGHDYLRGYIPGLIFGCLIRAQTFLAHLRSRKQEIALILKRDSYNRTNAHNPETMNAKHRERRKREGRA